MVIAAYLVKTENNLFFSQCNIFFPFSSYQRQRNEGKGKSRLGSLSSESLQVCLYEREGLVITYKQIISECMSLSQRYLLIELDVFLKYTNLIIKWLSPPVL